MKLRDARRPGPAGSLILGPADMTLDGDIALSSSFPQCSSYTVLRDITVGLCVCATHTTRVRISCITFSPPLRPSQG